MSPRTPTVAALLLALCVVAPAPAQSTAALQGQLDALVQQIHLRYRHHQPSLAKRRAATEAALQKWNRVAGLGDPGVSQRNQELMSRWLEFSLRRVMPGGSGELPSPPRFEQTAAPQATLPAPGAVEGLEPLGSRQSGPSFPVAEAPIRAADSPAGADGPALQSQFIGPRASRRVAAKPVAPPATQNKPADETPEEPTTPAAPQRSKWSRHPSAAPLEWRDPFTDDPSASPNPLRSGARRQSLRPVLGGSDAVAVNLRRLSAEVRGYNVALRELQATVMTLDATDVYGLTAAADELERLDQRRRFLDLYREGLAPSELRALPDSPSAELVHELIRRKAETLSRRATRGRPHERRALEALNNRLADLGDGGSF